MDNERALILSAQRGENKPRAEKDKKALTGIRARLKQFITGSLQKK